MAGIDEYVTLLIQSETSDGSVIFEDTNLLNCPSIINVVGGVTHSTSQAKYGSSSILFPGSDDVLSIPASSKWNFETYDFTIDFWLRFISLPVNSSMCFLSNYLSSVTGFSFQYRNDGALGNRLVFGNGDPSTYVTWAPSIDTWYHIEIGRNGPYLRFFVDGTQTGSTQINSYNITGSTNPLLIGALYSGGYLFDLNAYIEELRISKGICRHTGNFTPPTEPYSLISNDVSWLLTPSLWKNRIKFTVDSSLIDSDLKCFPVLIKISSASGITAKDLSAFITYMSSNANQLKIAITTEDGQTQCYGEIGWWDSEIWIHFKAPFISSSSDTDFYIYYDITKDDNITYIGRITTTPSKNVWDVNYKAVHHIGAGATGATNVKESTSTGIHGTTLNVESEDFANNYVDLDGTSEGINCGGSAILHSLNTITIEALINSDVNTTETIFQYGKGAGMSWGMSIDLGIFGANKLGFGFYNGAWRIVSDVDNFTASQLTHVVGRFTGTQLTIWVNGVQKNYTNYTGNFDYSSVNGLNIGCYYASGYTSFFNGKIYETRVSVTARSDAWVKATAKSLLDILLTYSDPETLVEISGTVQEEGSASAKVVRAYKRLTGEILSETTSDVSDGSYSFFVPPNEGIYVICLDDDEDYNDQIYGKLIP